MRAESLFCGVDVGASAAKLVLVDADGEIVARDVRPSGVDYRGVARSCRDAAVAGAGLDADGIVRYAHRAIAGLTFRPVDELIGELEKITP